MEGGGRQWKTARKRWFPIVQKNTFCLCFTGRPRDRETETTQSETQTHRHTGSERFAPPTQCHPVSAASNKPIRRPGKPLFQFTKEGSLSYSFSSQKQEQRRRTTPVIQTPTEKKSRSEQHDSRHRNQSPSSSHRKELRVSVHIASN